MSEVKQVIVIRKDLKMRRGKEIAQGSHASIAFLTNRLNGSDLGLNPMITGLHFSEAEMQWIHGSFTKVCLQVNSEAELLEINQKSKEAGLKVHLIQDAGLTEFGGIPTYTCLAIGPDYSEKIDKITSELKLY